MLGPKAESLGLDRCTVPEAARAVEEVGGIENRTPGARGVGVNQEGVWTWSVKAWDPLLGLLYPPLPHAREAGPRPGAGRGRR